MKKACTPNPVTHERLGRILAGVAVLVTVALGFFHHPLWLLLTAGAALNLAVSGITDRCVVKDLLIRMGLPGERDVGRAEAELRTLAEKEGSSFRRVAPRVKVTVN